MNDITFRPSTHARAALHRAFDLAVRHDPSITKERDPVARAAHREYWYSARIELEQILEQLETAIPAPFRVDDGFVKVGGEHLKCTSPRAAQLAADVLDFGPKRWDEYGYATPGAAREDLRRLIRWCGNQQITYRLTDPINRIAIRKDGVAHRRTD